MIRKSRFTRLQKFIFSTLAAILFLSIGVRAIAYTPKHYTEIEFPPLPEVTLPEYQRYQLDNGMVVYLIEDRDLPLINGTALIRTGTRYEPSDKVGLARLTGSLMRTGGTENYTPEELNATLEENAASVESRIGTTTGSASFNTLTEDLDIVLELFSEVLQQPVFAPDKLELAKNQSKGAIARRNDDPQEIADREFDKLIYGASSPYGRTVEYETLDNIQREDVVAFYQNYIRPENMILGIVGDFETSEMLSKVKEAFGDWNVATPNPLLEKPSVTQENQGGIYVIDRPELTQSSVLIGHLGGTLENPDYPVLSVLNGLLNGFGGRLFNEVRSRQGLAYSVYGVWNPNYDYPGKFYAGGQTQTETTVPFIKSVLGEIKELQNNPVGKQELEDAKESILNSFVFNFQNPSQTLSRLMRYEYFGYPEDFIFKYQEGIKNTTVKDIQQAAQKYLKPEQAVTLVVGNKSAIDPSLDTLDEEVVTLNID